MHYFPYDVKLWLLAHSRSFLANQKARNAIVGAENLLITVITWPHGGTKFPREHWKWVSTEIFILSDQVRFYPLKLNKHQWNTKIVPFHFKKHNLLLWGTMTKIIFNLDWCTPSKEVLAAAKWNTLETIYVWETIINSSASGLLSSFTMSYELSFCKVCK